LEAGKRFITNCSPYLIDESDFATQIEPEEKLAAIAQEEEAWKSKKERLKRLEANREREFRTCEILSLTAAFLGLLCLVSFAVLNSK
jgi:hypothetical protein